MLIKIIEDDIRNSNSQIIIHQVNCKTIGSGVAKALCDKWIIIKEKHKYACEMAKKNNESNLGKIQVVKVTDTQKVINMFSQDNYGYDEKMYTSYDAINTCLGKVKDYCVKNGYKRIALPYKMCCCRGGANWDVIMAMIKANFEDTDILIEIWKLDNG
jgi:O-acetyl-ADP-ribose deacetylase (regulator of RNase III)